MADSEGHPGVVSFSGLSQAVPGFLVSLQSCFVMLKGVKEIFQMKDKKKSHGHQQYFSPAPRTCEVLWFMFCYVRGYNCTVAFEELSELL